MATYSLVGMVRRNGEYNGKSYEGYNLHVLEPNVVNGEQHGFLCDKFFVTDSKIKEPIFIDSLIEVTFNKYGKVESVRPYVE